MTSMSKHVNTGTGKDIISTLPESLLIHILSSLPTRDAVRTSVLSWRWKDVWAFVPNLYFNEWISANTLPDNDTSFMAFVDRVLLLHKLPCIKVFGVSGYTGIDVSRLRDWISVAIMCSVQQIDIQMFPSERLSLPLELFTCKTLELLRLLNELEEFDVPASVHWPNLKVLHVSLHFPGNDLTQKLFSSSPMLEDLYIRANMKNEEDIILNISTPSLRVLDLNLVAFLGKEHFERGIVYSENKIVVDAPALEDLIVEDDYLACYSLKNLTSLVSANLRVGHCCMDAVGTSEHANELFTLLEGITMVKFLTLDSPTMGVLDFADDNKLPLFPNLTYLKLVVHYCYSWRRLPDLLSSAPNLVTLVLLRNPTAEAEILNYDLSWVEPQRKPTCLLSHLENLTVTGFNKDDDELKLVKYFLENGEVLNKVIIGSCDHLTEEEQRDFLEQVQTFRRVSKTCQIIQS